MLTHRVQNIIAIVPAMSFILNGVHVVFVSFAGVLNTNYISDKFNGKICEWDTVAII